LKTPPTISTDKQYLGFFLWVWGLIFSAPCWNGLMGAL